MEIVRRIDFEILGMRRLKVKFAVLVLETSWKSPWNLFLKKVRTLSHFKKQLKSHLYCHIAEESHHKISWSKLNFVRRRFKISCEWHETRQQFLTKSIILSCALIPGPVTCSSNQWQCVGTSHCLDLAQVCDGNNDCGDNSDEGPHCRKLIV